MLPTINTILYATDLSENSRRAFSYAASLAQSYNARILVLHIVEPVNPGTYMQINAAMGEAEWINLQLDYENSLHDDLNAKLRQFCEQIRTSIDTLKLNDDQLFIRKGLPVEEIITMAVDKQADVIVMGTHGYGMVKDALMGGTVRRVVRRSAIPVLVVRNGEQTAMHAP